MSVWFGDCDLVHNPILHRLYNKTNINFISKDKSRPDELEVLGAR